MKDKERQIDKGRLKETDKNTWERTEEPKKKDS